MVRLLAVVVLISTCVATIAVETVAPREKRQFNPAVFSVDGYGRASFGNSGDLLRGVLPMVGRAAGQLRGGSVRVSGGDGGFSVSSRGDLGGSSFSVRRSDGANGGGISVSSGGSFGEGSFNVQGGDGSFNVQGGGGGFDTQGGGGGFDSQGGDDGGASDGQDNGGGETSDLGEPDFGGGSSGGSSPGGSSSGGGNSGGGYRGGNVGSFIKKVSNSNWRKQAAALPNFMQGRYSNFGSGFRGSNVGLQEVTDPRRRGSFAANSLVGGSAQRRSNSVQASSFGSGYRGPQPGGFSSSFGNVQTTNFGGPRPGGFVVQQRARVAGNQGYSSGQVRTQYY